MKDVSRSIRKRDSADKSNGIYDVKRVWDKITENSLALKAYHRIIDQGVNVFLESNPLDFSMTMGQFDPIEYEVIIYESNNLNAEEVISTMIHESTHVDFRIKKGIKPNSKYEEYKAACRSFLYDQKRRPSFHERRQIWDDVYELYPNLRIDRVPFFLRTE
ncbi:MAG: hypothetical protein HC930_18010 [Hydrococcus sp. SU_1_0]|nr:hypothetical protein [Hydrococcus sp. SU_1_0]